MRTRANLETRTDDRQDAVRDASLLYGVLPLAAGVLPLAAGVLPLAAEVLPLAAEVLPLAAEVLPLAGGVSPPHDDELSAAKTHGDLDERSRARAERVAKAISRDPRLIDMGDAFAPLMRQLSRHRGTPAKVLPFPGNAKQA